MSYGFLKSFGKSPPFGNSKVLYSRFLEGLTLRNLGFWMIVREDVFIEM